jgi:hypothetical protein
LVVTNTQLTRDAVDRELKAALGNSFTAVHKFWGLSLIIGFGYT